MEQAEESRERKGTNDSADIERKMMISRRAIQTMWYKRDEYNIDVIGDGTYGCLRKNIIKTKGLRLLGKAEAEMRSI